MGNILRAPSTLTARYLKFEQRARHIIQKYFRTRVFFSLIKPFFLLGRFFSPNKDLNTKYKNRLINRHIHKTDKSESTADVTPSSSFKDRCQRAFFVTWRQQSFGARVYTRAFLVVTSCTATVRKYRRV